MIKSFRHKGLRIYWEKGNPRYLNVKWLPRIRRMLQILDCAVLPEDTDLPGYHFHPLAGKDKGRYSLRVTGNWRMTFTFDGNDVVFVDLEDYH